MERVMGIDMWRLRTEILSHERRELRKVGPGRVKCSGYELICQTGSVVTVVA